MWNDTDEKKNYNNLNTNAKEMKETCIDSNGRADFEWSLNTS